jgi:hypothetical protein
LGVPELRQEERLLAEFLNPECAMKRESDLTRG